MSDTTDQKLSTIPIADPELGQDERDRVQEVLDSGMLADGPVVREFEEAFAEYCRADHAVATSNGTTALHAVFEALDLEPGAAVVTTPFSFIASANAIRLAGATPVFADVDPETYTLDPDAVEATIEAHDGDVAAILAVHLYGLPADMNRLAAIADEHDAWLIEDAAQAHGATVDGDRVGSIGDAACFSFYPTKNMTTGEGGMVTTDDEELAERVARYINHGRTETYGHAEVGHNFRMTSIAGAIGLAQLERLPEYIEARQANAAALDRGLEAVAVDGGTLRTPHVPDDRTHVYHQYTIRVADREGLKAHLEENAIGYGVYYPRCIHDQPAYGDVSTRAPVAERAAEEVLSLPVHPGVDAEGIDRIIDAVRSYGDHNDRRLRGSQ